MTDHPGSVVPYPPPQTPHPSPAVLIAHHAGELSEAEADTVREHLVDCERCLQSVLAMSQLQEELRTTTEPSDDPAMATHLAAFRKRRDAARSLQTSPFAVELPANAKISESRTEGQEPEGASPPVPFPPGPAPIGSQWSRFAQAALVVFCVGLSWLAVSQRRDLDQLSTPVGNPETLSFRLGSNTRGSHSGFLAPRTGGLLVKIHVGVEYEQQTFRAVLSPASGETEGMTIPDLVRKKGTQITLHVPRQILRSDVYQLAIFGTDPQGQESLLDTFKFRLEIED